MLDYTWFELLVIAGVTALVGSLIGSPGKRRPKPRADDDPA